MADETTFGRFLLNEVLPSDMQVNGPVTKKELQSQMRSYAQRDPKGYVKTVSEIKRVGDQVATWEGLSVGLDDIQPDYAKRDPVIKDALKQISATKSIEQKRKILNETEKKIVQLTGEHPSDMTLMAKSGGRGSIPQLMKTVSSPIAATDEHGEITPWLITKSYSQGLNPADAWVAGAEARRGVIASTGSVVEPGAVAKVVTTNMQNLVVTKVDCGTTEGLLLPVSDQIEDRYLARGDGGFARNTLVTPEVANELAKKKVPRVLVRSAMTCDVDDGVCQKCMGTNEWGRDYPIGTNVGMRSAQAMTEPLTQFVLNAKHGVRLAGGDTDSKALIGLDGFRVLTEVPQSFTQRAAIAQLSGRVESVQKAPQGGWYITVAGKQYYSGPKLQPIVKVGDFVEAGDALTAGVAMPDEVVQHKGIGEGRRYLSSQLTNLYRRQGVDIDRRHTELLARNAVNYVRIDQDPTNTFIPGDIVKFKDVKKALATQSDSVPLDKAEGRILATQTLHYTAGTNITPSVVERLKQEGIKDVQVAKGGPTFEPIMKSIIRTPLLDDDWMSRLSHRYLKKTLVEGAGFGMSSDAASTDPVPAYVMGSRFGWGADGKYAADEDYEVTSFIDLGPAGDEDPTEPARMHKQASTKEAKSVGFLRRALLGGGDDAFNAIKGTRLIGRWGGMDPEAYDAEKVWKWLPEATRQRLADAGKGFFDNGKLTREGSARFRAIEDMLPMLSTRTDAMTPDEIKKLRSLGIDFSDSDLQAIENARGGTLTRIGRGVRESLFGEAPLRMIGQRFQTGGLFGRGGVLFGDIGLSPSVQRAWKDVVDPKTRSLGAVGRLGMYGGMDLADKTLSYGLPAYSAYELATSGEEQDPTKSKGEAIGSLAGDVFGWGIGSPFGLAGGGVIASNVTDAATRLGRALDPPKMTPEQAQQQARDASAREKYLRALQSHKYYQMASGARDLGEHAVDFGQQAYHQLQQPTQSQKPRSPNPLAATHGPLPQTGNWL